MNHIGLFEGIGGFSLAARGMNWKTIAWCEINPFCQQVLKYHFPDAKGHSDIKETDFTIYRGLCNIITGGFPCQPYSQAGNRKGKEDERHLWPEMLRAIREVQPTWVVGENVSGLVNWNGGMVFNEVQADMEAEGYEVTPFLLPACGKDAPHRRERIWFIAYSHSNRNRNIERQDREKDSLQKFNRQAVHAGEFVGTDTRDATDATSELQQGYERGQDRVKGGEVLQPKNRLTNTKLFRTASESGDAANTCDTGLQRCEVNGSFGSIWQERNEQFAGLLQPNWQEFPTQSPLCSRNDGLSGELAGITFSKHRNESIKAYGNAIVPQVALEIFKAIEAFEEQQNKNV
jgi:DNA (cytosine-5)-methyltransferase 1